MGTMFYGSQRLPIVVDDHLLTHLAIVATAKLRRGESFLISWTESPMNGGGRSSVWIHPSADLHYKFDLAGRVHVDRALLDSLNIEALQPAGIQLTDTKMPESAKVAARSR